MRPTGDELARFAGAVATRLGLRVDLDRSGEVIERRAAAHRGPISAYLDQLDHADPEEVRALASELTVGETYFLRHIEQFRAFVDRVVPDRLGHGHLQILSVGCSSGEEPYTLAMLLRESYPAAAFTIRAIDVNANAIARARAARYSRWSLRATTPAFEQRWFRVDGRDVVVVPEIRAAVTFANANVLDDAELTTAGRWDVVFCRNMIMYFTDDQQDAVIARLARALAPGGYLFLGHAETLRDRSEGFALCHTHGAFYYQRTDPGADAVLPAHRAPSAATTVDPEWYDDIRAAMQRVHAMIDGALDAQPHEPPGQAPTAVSKHAGAPSSPVPRAQALGPSPAAALDAEQVRELLAQERFSEALERLDRLPSATAADRDVAMLRALVLTHAGRFVEARTACGELLALDASNAGASYVLALCCDSTGDTAGAARMAHAAAELDPSFAMPRVHLGLLARRLGEHEVASSELTRAIALLEREDPSRLALFGGGFNRQTLLGMCRAELAAIGARR